MSIGDKFKKLRDQAKQIAMKKMLDKQLAGLSDDQKKLVMKMIEENPDFFEKIAKEIEAEVKAGKNQMAASMSVMKKYQGDLQKIMMSAQGGGDPKMSNRNLQ